MALKTISFEGNEAIYRVLTQTKRESEVAFDRISTECTTTMSTQGLMMEGLRLLDEANRDAS